MEGHKNRKNMYPPSTPSSLFQGNQMRAYVMIHLIFGIGNRTLTQCCRCFAINLIDLGHASIWAMMVSKNRCDIAKSACAFWSSWVWSFSFVGSTYYIMSSQGFPTFFCLFRYIRSNYLKTVRVCHDFAHKWYEIGEERSELQSRVCRHEFGSGSVRSKKCRWCLRGFDLLRNSFSDRI